MAAGLGRFVHAVERMIVGVGVVTIVLSVLWGVATRYVSQMPAAWTSEVAAIAFCWTCLIGAALLYGSNAHPRIYDPAVIARPGVRRLVVVLGKAVEFGVLIGLTVLSIKQSHVNLDNPTSILRVPISIYYLPLAWFGLSSLARLLTRA